MSANESLQDDYRRAGFGGALELGERPALLVIDFLAGYFDPASPMYSDSAIPALRAALAAALAVRAAATLAGVPIVITESRLAERELPFMLMGRKGPLDLMVAGSPFGALTPQIEPGPAELVLNKRYPSAFFATRLGSLLVAARIDSLIITGLTTSGCVRATCVDAICNGFAPIVIEDAVADRAAGPHHANLLDMGSKYAGIMRSNEIIALLRRKFVQRDPANP